MMSEDDIQPQEPQSETPAPAEQLAPPVQQSPGFDWSQPPEQQSVSHAGVQYSSASPNDGMQKLIPTKNANALAAYYCAVFAAVPCFTPFLSPAAIILGVKGLNKIKEDPNMPGKGHALFGIIVGIGFLLVYGAIFLLILVAAANRS